MINSKVLQELQQYFYILENYRGKTIWEIKKDLNIKWHSHFKKGASWLIIENMLWLENNSSKKADLESIWVEIKVLPITLNNRNWFKAKEPTQIKMINFMKVAQETRETAEIKDKIKIIFWIVYWVEKKNGKNVSQDNYIVLDYFLDHPDDQTTIIFKEDWEEIQSYIIKGDWDKLSCSMGKYIEPKTKWKNNQDKTPAPNGKWWIIMVRRRAFYFKKRYTNEKIIPNLNLDNIEI